MTHIELSQEELDLIQAKREEEVVREKAKQDRIEADIVKARVNIAKRVEESRKQIAAAESFLSELGKDWTAYTDTHETEERVYWGSEVVWKETYNYNNMYASRGKYKVTVNKHTVYSGTWGRGNDKGYKMFVSGPEIEYGYSQKALIKAATVNKKVEDCIDTINAREDHKKKKASAVETAVHNLQVAYPNAIVNASRDWARGYNSKNGYREYDKITIQFGNGIQVAYEVYSDGSLSRLSVNFGGLEHNEVLNALSEIPPHVSE